MLLLARDLLGRVAVETAVDVEQFTGGKLTVDEGEGAIALVRSERVDVRTLVTRDDFALAGQQVVGRGRAAGNECYGEERENES